MWEWGGGVISIIIVCCIGWVLFYVKKKFIGKIWGGGVFIFEKRLGLFSVGKNEFYEMYSNYLFNDFDKIEREYLELINF